MRLRCVGAVLSIMLLVSSCRPAGPGSQPTGGGGTMTEIRGTLDQGAGQPVLLEEMAAREFIPLDTVTCGEGGEFTFRFSASAPAFYALRTGTTGYVTLLVDPGERVRVNGTYGLGVPYSVDGSPGSEILADLASEHKRTLDELAELQRRSREIFSGEGSPRLREELEDQFDSITSSFRRYSIDFIEEHCGSLATLIALYNLYGHDLPVFEPSVDFQVYRFADSCLQKTHPSAEAVELLHAQVTEAEALRNTEARDPQSRVGEIAPDFVSSRPDGSLLSLSELRGNIVLLSFWAGWSNPSVEENRYLRQCWEEFGDRAFRILQVSLDSDRDTWMAAISKTGQEWEHVSDLRRWDTPVVDLYGVERIPSNFLLDPEGRIIAADLFGEELVSKLERLFNNS